MRRRGATARAFFGALDVLVMVEPYAGLDEASKDVVDDVARQTTARGGTVLLATHDPTRGGTAGRVLFMEAGRLLPEGRRGRSFAGRPRGAGRAPVSGVQARPPSGAASRSSRPCSSGSGCRRGRAGR